MDVALQWCEALTRCLFHFNESPSEATLAPLLLYTKYTLGLFKPQRAKVLCLKLRECWLPQVSTNSAQRSSPNSKRYIRKLPFLQ